MNKGENNTQQSRKLPRFERFSFYFVPKKLVRTQAKILSEKIVERGGMVTFQYCESTTHILLPRGVTFEQCLDAIDATNTGSKTLRDDVAVVRIDWLPECLKTATIVHLQQFTVEKTEHDLTPRHAKKQKTVHKHMRLELSGTTKLPFASKLFEYVTKFFNAKDDLLLKVDIKHVWYETAIAKEKKSGIGIFFDFPVKGCQQIGWIPMEKVEDVELMLNSYSLISNVVSTRNMDVGTFNKLTITVDIAAID